MAFAPDCIRNAAVTLTSVTNGHREMSPYSFDQTPYDFMGGMWQATIDLTHLDGRESAEAWAWLLSLQGPVGSFELPALDYDGPFGAITADPVVALSAPVRGQSLTVTLAAGNFLVAGDQVTIDGHLHSVTGAAAKVGSDQVLTLWPRLRADVAPGVVVHALAPYGTWALADQKNTYARSQSRERSQTLAISEAL